MTTAFLVSTLVVAIAEIGDKTQLLSLLLATRFRKPLPIIAGILFATLANHALAALFGEWVRAQFDPGTLRWVLGLSLLAIAAWALKPDTLDSEVKPAGRYGVFLLTLALFFVVEIGDKTQIATSLLAARFHDIVFVTIGTTLGMMIANVPAVYMGEAITRLVPLAYVRLIAAALFALLGLWVIGTALVQDQG